MTTLGQISTAAPIAFVILHATAYRWYVFGLILLLGTVIGLTLYSGWLQDPDKYYSLGLAQMLFWFVLIVASFGYIWMITADRNVQVPNSVLALMGISAGTGLAAGLIDNNKRQARAAALPVLPPVPARPAPAGFFGRVARFFHDILCSDQSIDLHRFQIFVWTLLLGVVFVRTVYAELAMPDFDNTLLTLMGISSGTYIGFKFPEPS